MVPQPIFAGAACISHSPLRTTAPYTTHAMATRPGCLWWMGNHPAQRSGTSVRPFSMTTHMCEREEGCLQFGSVQSIEQGH